jgi:hypothetical protein
MEDIRLFELDGDFLVLEAQDGQKFRLLVDETIRASVKREQKPTIDSFSITPRVIQDEIRNGSSIEDLVASSNATFEFIEKFAAPVIAELNHVVSSALSVRLTIAGDRYNDSTQIEFGEIIGARLVSSGADSISWLAKKIDVNNWHVIANYALDGTPGSAIWSFDPRRLSLSPESETAIALSSQEVISNTPIPKLRKVELPDSSKDKSFEIAGMENTQVFDGVVPIGRGQQPETPVAKFFNEERPASSTPAAFLKPVVEMPTEAVSAKNNSSPERLEVREPKEPNESLSATADLLEALRRKRTERDTGNLDTNPETTQIRVVDIEVSKAETPVTPAQQDSRDQAQEDLPVPKKGRASMPSWDEIVFGTKVDE